MQYEALFVFFFLIWTCIVVMAAMFGRQQALKVAQPDEAGFFDPRPVPEWFDIGSIIQKPLLCGADFLTDILVIVQMSNQEGARSIFWLAMICFIFYLGSTATLTFFNSSKEQRAALSLLQLLNLRIIYETTYAIFRGRTTPQLEEIVVMSSLFEAFPQVFLQAYFSVWYFDHIPLITGASIVFSCMTLARSVNHYQDIYGIVSLAHSHVDQAITHITLRFWRTAEILFRVFVFTYTAYHISREAIFVYFVLSSMAIFVACYYLRSDLLFSQPKRLQSACLNILCLDLYIDRASIIANSVKVLEGITLFVVLLADHDWDENASDIVLFATISWIWCMCSLLLLPWMGRYHALAVHFARERNKDRLMMDAHWDAFLLLSERDEIEIVELNDIALLRDQGYELSHFRRARIAPAVLRESGYGMQDFQKARFDVADFFLAGYNARQIYIAGFWTMKDLQHGGYSVQDYVNEQFRPREIMEAGFRISDIRSFFSVQEILEAGIEVEEFLKAGFSVEELRKAHIVAYMLYDYGVSARELREGGFEAAELIDARRKPLFSPQELVDAGYKTKDLIVAGNSASVLENIGLDVSDADEVPLAKLVEKNVSLQTIHKLKFPISEIRQHFKLKEMIRAGFTDSELKSGGFGIMDFMLEGYTIDQLQDAGFGLFELRVNVPKMISRHPQKLNLKDLFVKGFFPDLQKANFSLEDFKNGGISAESLRLAGYDLTSLKQAGYTPQQLRKAGYPMASFLEAKFTTLELRKAGFSPDELGYVAPRRATVVDDPEEHLQKLFSEGLSSAKARDMGYTFVELFEVGYTGMQIWRAGYCLAEMRKELNAMINILKSAREDGLQAQELQMAGLKNCAIYKTVGFSASEMKECGCEPVDLNSGGYSVEELLRAGYAKESLQDLKKNRKRAFDNLKQRKFTVSEIVDSGFTIDEVVNHLDKDDFKKAEVVQALKKRNVSANVMAKRGSTLHVLKDAGFKAKHLKQVDGFHPNEFRVAFTATELRKAGFESEFFKQEEGVQRQPSQELERRDDINLLEQAWKQKREHLQIAPLLRSNTWNQRMGTLEAQIHYLEEKTGLSIPVLAKNQSSEEEVDDILDDDDFEIQEGSVSGGLSPKPLASASTPPVKSCRKCGASLAIRNAKFCSQCGSAVIESPPVEKRVPKKEHSSEGDLSLTKKRSPDSR